MAGRSRASGCRSGSSPRWSSPSPSGCVPIPSRSAGDAAYGDVMNMGEMYRTGRIGMIDMGRSLTDEQAAEKVPACPHWSIKDVYAHQAGVVADALAGR